MGRYYDRVPCPYDYPNDCNCRTCVSDRGGHLAKQERSESRGSFDGKEARIIRESGTITVYYGGRSGNTRGDGHGHVKAQGGLSGETIVFWRLPESEGGAVVIDNFASTERLADHLSGLW